MSIFDKLFGAAQPTPAPQPQQQLPQPGNTNPAAPGADPANPTVPQGTVEASKKEPESPLDQFGSLWQPSDNKEGPQPVINVDPKQLAEAASKTDFRKMISQEQLTAIQAGGEQAAAAFAEAINKVAQGVYAQSAFATTKIVEQAVNRAREQFQAEIPAHIKRQAVSDSLRNENPVFNHPAASPILGAIEAQMTAKFPNATASEITSMAKQYLENFASAVTAPAAAAKKAEEAKNSKDFDWNSYLS